MDDSKLVEMRRLIGKVAERHGIRIDLNDPAFYVLSLNEFAIEEATKNIVEGIRNATHDFEQAAERVHRQAGAILAHHIKGAISGARQEFDDQILEVTEEATEKLAKLYRIHTRFAAHWAAAGLASLLIFVIGVLVGRILH